MRWKGRRQSDNLEDRRGIGPRGVVGGGIGTLVLVLLVALLGGDPRALLEAGGPSMAPRAAPSAQEEQLKEMVGVVLADTEEVWREQFRRLGRKYREPRLVLFSGQVESACGLASSAVGPFYCGEDRTIYLDLSFFEDLSRRFGAPGDFAQAYVIAHEVGHHVQKELGTLDEVHQARRRLSERDANRLSVRLELQADFYAGVWAHHARSIAQIDEGDIREAITAASAIGDDRLQQESQGRVVPDSFTHGTSDQRMRWFTRGWRSGDMAEGDTFRTRSL